MQKKTKNLVSWVLRNLRENIDRTQDPLGCRNDYWDDWIDEIELPKDGNLYLLTGRMYQMLPYVVRTTELVSTVKPLVGIKGLETALNLGKKFLGERILRFETPRSRQMKIKVARILKGILAALQAVDCRPGYLYEKEPYCGALLHDLGLDSELSSHAARVHECLKRHDAREVITIDPHSMLMLKKVYPANIGSFDIGVKHYLEVLSERSHLLRSLPGDMLPEPMVLHDPCTLMRELGLVEQARKVLAALSVRTVEPENTKENTFCCGGPVESCFPELSESVAERRIKELARASKNILVMCPICLVNFAKFEHTLGLNVMDMGEVLFMATRSGAREDQVIYPRDKD